VYVEDDMGCPLQIVRADAVDLDRAPPACIHRYGRDGRGVFVDWRVLRGVEFGAALRGRQLENQRRYGRVVADGDGGGFQGDTRTVTGHGGSSILSFIYIVCWFQPVRSGVLSFAINHYRARKVQNRYADEIESYITVFVEFQKLLRQSIHARLQALPHLAALTFQQLVK
jgi:hypothetical protein